jgi:hypothetical protein
MTYANSLHSKSPRHPLFSPIGPSTSSNFSTKEKKKERKKDVSQFSFFLLPILLFLTGCVHDIHEARFTINFNSLVV